MIFGKEESGSRSWRLPLGLLLAFSLALATFFSGIRIGTEMNNNASVASWFGWSGAQSVSATSNENRPDLKAFWEVWDLLEKKFATGSGTTNISDEVRIEGAINGLVEAYGDPYTVFMSPTNAESFNQDISGNFSGVGMEIGIRDRILTVIAPLPETPAEKAGLLTGDKIIRINGTSTENMRVDSAVALIRGEKGTVVELVIYRDGEADFLTIPVTRDNITVPTTKTEQIGDVYVITLYSFNAVAEKQFTDALKEFQASKAKKLIVDLRGNPGGFLQGAVNIASRFLPAGKIVVQESFSDPSLNETMRSRGGQVTDFSPERLVVLIDNGSASASEIVAGALQDHKVATLIGTQTFGKGSVQELLGLSEGAALKVTVARWLTPNGTSISNGGLKPDIVINRTPQQRIDNEDPQLQAALRFLAGEKVVSDTLEAQLTEGSTSTGE